MFQETSITLHTLNDVADVMFWGSFC